MLSLNKIISSHFYLEKNGTFSKYGKISHACFDLDKGVLVAFFIKRPDFALMVKRKDRVVLAKDIKIRDKELYAVDSVVNKYQSDDKLINGIDLKKTYYLLGLSVYDCNKQKLGQVVDVYFDEESFSIEKIQFAASDAQKLILGSVDFKLENISKTTNTKIILKENVDVSKLNDGIASKAGTSWAVISDSAGKVAKKGAQDAQIAFESGTKKVAKKYYEAKDKITSDEVKQKTQKQVSKYAKMFSDFKEEFDKASKD
ncbi:MAG: PRC-barrel domain-containing protein [Coriobacteriales bacterium]|nr:PRC-barrel domain-containing protein [Coriobacteriales bacterium]